MWLSTDERIFKIGLVVPENTSYKLTNLQILLLYNISTDMDTLKLHFIFKFNNHNMSCRDVST